MTATYVTYLIRERFGSRTAALEKPFLVHPHGQCALFSKAFSEDERRDIPNMPWPMGITPQRTLRRTSGKGRDHGFDSGAEGAKELPHYERSNATAPLPAEHVVRMGADEPYSGCSFGQWLSLRSQPSG